MDNYLSQFKNLPRELRQAVSSEEKIKLLEEIEKKYNLKLIKLVVRVMIKDISWPEIEKFCQENFHLLPEKAAELKKDLAEKIFNEVLGYLNKQESRIQQVVSSSGKGIEAGIENKELGMVKGMVGMKKLEEQKEPELNIQKVKDDFERIKLTINQNISQDDLIRKIISELNLRFEDTNLEKRFENIVKSYFRDIRTVAQVEEVLKKAQKISGLGLSSDQTALIIRIIQEFKKQTTPSNKKYFVEREVGKEILEPRIQQVASSSRKIEETEKGGELPIKTQILQFLKEEGKEKTLVTKPPTLAETQKPTEIQKRFEGGTIKPFFQKIEKPLAIQPSQNKPQAFAKKESFFASSSAKSFGGQSKASEGKGESFSIPIKKPIYNDNLIRDVSNGRLKAIGPVEELASITLDDLNHWGGGEKTAKIVLDKINLLKEISLTKKAEAIRAWQKSPLYFLYLEIGQAALKNSQSISQTIEERKRNSQPTFELEDFEAVAGLNRKLRF